MEELMPPAGDGGVADHGVATSMQVVVKAANQKYNDQTIQCQGTWTVKKLKAHLAEVYPCKPREHQQKIIFSGRLLQDHLVLKDVLRSFDPTCPTTVHLVCSPGVDSKEASPTPGHGAAAPATTATTTTSSGVRRRTTATTASTAANTGTGTTTTSVASNQVPSTHAQPPSAWQYPPNWNMEAYNSWVQQYYNTAQPNSPQQQRSASVGPAGDYMNMYQQYWQYYMYMQYAQYMHASSSTSPQNIPQAAAPTTVVADEVNAPAAVEPRANANNEAPGAAAPPQAVGAAGGGGAMFEDDEDDGRNRDWLDWLYVGSRLGVLLSIIYFYSTVGRFMLVFGFCFLVYIVRNHLYANRNNRQRRNNNNAVNDVVEPPAAEAPVAAAVAPGVDPGARDPAPAADAAPANAAVENEQPGRAINDDADDDTPPVLPPVEGPSPWNVVLTIITTFFSSLVPQPPPGN